MAEIVSAEKKVEVGNHSYLIAYLMMSRILDGGRVQTIGRNTVQFRNVSILFASFFLVSHSYLLSKEKQEQLYTKLYTLYESSGQRR